MVSANVLATITNATDNDPPGPFLIDDRYAVLAWYRDSSYTSDEYGCTSIPNIFHIWLIDLTQLAGQTPPNVPHINVLGSECTPHWMWSNYPYNIAYKGGKRYLILGGGRYVSSSNIVRRLVIVDITNIAAPSVVKVLEDTQSYGSPNDVVYDDQTDKICVQTSDAVFRCDTLSNILNYPVTATLRDIPAVSTRPAVSGAIAKVGTRYVYIWGDAVYDLDTGYIQTSPFPSNVDFVYTSDNYVVVLLASTTDTRNKVGVEIRDPDMLSIIKTINFPSLFFVDPSWNLGLSVEKDSIILIGGDSSGSRFMIIDIQSGSVTTGTLPQNIWTNYYLVRMKYRGGYLVWERASPATGRLLHLLPDSFVNIVYDSANRRVQLLDQLGNPIASKTTYIRILRATGTARLLSGTLIQRTSDVNGYISISDLSGWIRIEA